MAWLDPLSMKKNTKVKANKPNIFAVLKPYKLMIFCLIGFALLSNAVNLVIPKLISRGIDDFSKGNFSYPLSQGHCQLHKRRFFMLDAKELH